MAYESGEVSFHREEFLASSLEPGAQFIEDLLALAQQAGSEWSESEPFAAGIAPDVPSPPGEVRR